MVQTWVRGTFVDIRLAVWSCEANSAGANVSTDHVLTCASIHAWVRFTLIIVDVTVFSNPARVTKTFISIDFIFTVTVDTRITEALIDLRKACRVMESFRTHTGEPIDTINTSAPIVARVDGTLINVYVTHGPSVTRFTCTFIAIDFVNTGPVVTWIAFTVVNIDFTIYSSSSFGTVANVQIFSVLASASVSAWLA